MSIVAVANVLRYSCRCSPALPAGAPDDDAMECGAMWEYKPVYASPVRAPSHSLIDVDLFTHHP